MSYTASVDFTDEQIADLHRRYFPDHMFCPIRSCLLCGTPFGYIWYEDTLHLATSCECVEYQTEPKPATWEQVVAMFETIYSQPQPEPEAEWP